MGNAYYAEMISDLWRVGKEEEAKKLYESLIEDGILKSDPGIEKWFKPSEPISNIEQRVEKWIKSIRKHIEKEPGYITNFWNGFKNDASLTDEEMQSRLTSTSKETFVEIKEGKCKKPEITLTIACEFMKDVLSNRRRIQRHSKYIADVFRLIR